MKRYAVAALTVAILALTSACGDSSSAANTTTKRSFAAFTTCLKQHGVKDFGAPGQGQGFGGAPPSGGFGGGAPPSGGQFQGQPPSGGPPNISSKLRKAFAACSSLAPRRGQGLPSGNFPNGG